MGIDVDKQNKKLGITKGMVKAMQVGATAGWERIDADPARWNDDGTPKTNKKS